MAVKKKTESQKNTPPKKKTKKSEREKKHFFLILLFFRFRFLFGFFFAWGRKGTAPVHPPAKKSPKKRMRAFGRAKPIQWGTESFVFPAAIKLKYKADDAKREYEMQRMCASAYVVPVEYLEIARAIVMPAATMDLFAFLDSKERIEPAELWRIVRQMSAAVAAVHRKSVVHRDVKPENFLCFDEPCGDFDDWDDETDETGEADETDEADEADETDETDDEDFRFLGG